ncbi:MAG: hypothetical protein WCO98_14610, partial [bacterium]
NYGKQVIVSPILFLIMLSLGWLELTNRTPSWISFLVNNRLTKFSSNSSYGVYLFHGFFISAFGLILFKNMYLLALPSYQRVCIMFIFVTILAYLVAYLVYLFIEQPGINFGKSVIKKISRKTTDIL